jgi:hypothetical protein
MEIFDPALKAVLTLTAALFVKTICERVAAGAQVTDFRKLHRARWLTSEDFDASLAQEPHPPNS